MKQKVLHELREYFKVFLYLAPWFCAFSAYRMLILGRFADVSFDFGTAVVNALILSKVILIGEFFHLGKRHENRPLIYSTIYKSILFSLLAAAFRIVELIIRGVFHGQRVIETLASIQGAEANELIGRTVVMFFAFLPFFALRETGRVLGEQRLADLFFKPRALTH